MKHSKLVILGIGLLLLLLSACVVFGISPSRNVKAEESVVVSESETIDKSLFAGGENVNIAGTINGDVYCAGQSVSISGTVKGDVFCAGQTVNISGKVRGGVRVVGGTVTLSGTVQGSVTVGAQTLTVEKGSVIVRDLVGWAQNITLNGLVGRDVAASANTLTINGNVGRDVRGKVETLVVGSTGSVKGGVNYTSNNIPAIDKGGVISGDVTRTPPVNDPDASSFVQLMSAVVYTLIAILIASLVVALLLPNLLQEASSKATSKSGYVALVGLALVVLVPATGFLLLISAIGTPLGILLLLAWSVVILLSIPFAAYHVGRLVLTKTTKKPKPAPVMLLGSGIIFTLGCIPALGCFVILVAHLFGVGMLAPVLFNRLRRTAKA